MAICLLLATLPGRAEPTGLEEAKHRGVCLVGGRTRPTDDALDRLVELGATWISQTPFGRQRRYDDPDLRLVTQGRVWWGESDEGLIDTARRARARGLRTVLKPHIWIRDRSDGKWRGEIGFETDEAWETWWSRYRTFALHYAQLAGDHGMEVYCIGTELRSTVLEYPDRWRDLIEEIRTVYSGKLTYSANWYQEFEEVPFWDALDYVGIQAYFPLGDSQADDLSDEDLDRAWAPHARRIEAVQKRVGKPVIFTEIGYRSASDAAVEPWKWRSDAAVDDTLQVKCYEAVFRTFWEKPWLGGMYVWKWFPDYRASRRRRVGFTPQGKPAERVLREWYTGERSPQIEADKGG